ncbi:hypothetical protein EON67_05015 [archaeon]|nr:MAG: hypothetical protein EON67_05015 [archaeon]
MGIRWMRPPNDVPPTCNVREHFACTHANVCTRCPTSCVQADDALTSMSSFGHLLSNTSQAVSNELTPSLQDAHATLVQWYNAAAGDAATQQKVTEMQNAVTQATSTAESVGSHLNSTANVFLFNATLHGKTPEDLSNGVWTGGIVSLSLYLGFFALVALTLKAARCCAVTFKVCYVVLILVALLTFVFAGMFTAVTIVGSDICVAPSSSIISIANATGASAQTTATLTYYTTCGNDATVQPMGAYAQLLDGKAQVDDAAATLDTFPESSGPYQAYVDMLRGNFSTVNGTLSGLVTSISCTPVNNIYQDLLVALCSGGINATLTVMALAIAASIIVFFLLISAARLCCAHPGDLPMRPADLRAETVYMPFGTTPVAGATAPLVHGAAPQYAATAGHPGAYAPQK